MLKLWVEERASPDRIGWAPLSLFCLPMIVIQGIELPWKALIPAFFTQTLGQSLALTAFMLAALRLFDIAAELVIGWGSDQASFSWGWRKPWIALSVLPIVVGAYVVFFAQPGIAILLLGAGCLLLRTGYAMFTVIHQAWAFELASDHHDRTRVLGARIWSSSLASPLILLVPVLLESLYGASRATQMMALGLLIIVATPFLASLVLLVVRERIPLRARAQGWRLSFRGWKFDHPALPILLIFGLACWSDAVITATFVFFVEDALVLRGWAAALLILPPVLTVLALPLWARLSMTLGKRKTLTIVLWWQLMAAPLAIIVPAQELHLLILFLVLRCACWGADFMLLRSIVADICAQMSIEREHPTGGSYSALLGATQKLAASLGIAGALGMLAYGGYEPGRPAVNTDVLRLVFSIPTCIVAALSLLILRLGTQVSPVRESATEGGADYSSRSIE